MADPADQLVGARYDRLFDNDVEELKRRYADGEFDLAEFEKRVAERMAISEASLHQLVRDPSAPGGVRPDEGRSTNGGG